MEGFINRSVSIISQLIQMLAKKHETIGSQILFDLSVENRKLKRSSKYWRGQYFKASKKK